MHPEALAYVERFATAERISLLDIGGRDVNGTCRPLFPKADYYSVDLLAGSGVDRVGDVLEMELPIAYYDLVLCTEVFEHAQRWRQICWAARRWVKPGGRFVVTCAGLGRQPHSGIDGGPSLHLGEWYENIEPWALYDTLIGAGWTNIGLVSESGDLRATAVRPMERIW